MLNNNYKLKSLKVYCIRAFVGSSVFIFLGSLGKIFHNPFANSFLWFGFGLFIIAIVLLISFIIYNNKISNS